MLWPSAVITQSQQETEAPPLSFEASRRQEVPGSSLRALHFADDLERAFRQEYFKNSLFHARFVLMLGFILMLLLGVLNTAFAPPAIRALRLLYFGIDCVCILAVFLFSFSARFERYMQLALGFVVAFYGLNLIVMSVLYPSYVEGLIDYSPITLILIVMAGYTLTALRLLPATGACWIIVIAYEIGAYLQGYDRIGGMTGNTINLLIANLFGMLAGYARERYLRRDFLLVREVDAEREKSEQLLCNILPEAIAERLKREQRSIADSFAEVTVLFADIVDFTPLSAATSPSELVHLLNAVFSRFDLLAERHGLEKIKTIGDAYMVVGGLPTPRSDHAEAVAAMALEMQREAAQLIAPDGQPLRLRIGINTGPVVAGVIGKRKFIYDLWGDAVNMASRMESQGLPGCIQVSAETYVRLRDRFTFEERGPIPIKGRGEALVYLLIGERNP